MIMREDSQWKGISLPKATATGNQMLMHIIIAANESDVSLADTWSKISKYGMRKIHISVDLRGRN